VAEVSRRIDANLAPNDTSGVSDVFVRGQQTNITILASQQSAYERSKRCNVG
jgi:hypothetical protein